MQNNLIDAFLPDIQAAGRQHDLEQVIERICDRLGFIGYCFADCNTLFQETPNHIVRAVPGWVEAYLKENCLDVDPVLPRAMQSPFPFSGNSLFPMQSDDAPRHPGERVREIARAYGYHEVLGVPFHARGTSGHLRIGMISLHWPDTQRTFDRQFHQYSHQLQVLLGHWQQRALAEVSPDLLHLQADMPDALTARERDILCWAARGKTSAETAEILEISHQTVDFHIRNATRKLGATNRTNAVALALYKGLIFL